MEKEDKGTRYTVGQEQLLRLKTKNLTAEEQEELRKLLAPRSRYLPATDEKVFELIAFMLKDKYEVFLNCIEQIKLKFSAITFEWKIGDKQNTLYYKVLYNSKAICSIGIHLDSIEGIVTFDEKLCEAFERNRSAYNRMRTQWIFDIAPFENSKKKLYFDLTAAVLQDDFLNLLMLKINKK